MTIHFRLFILNAGLIIFLIRECSFPFASNTFLSDKNWILAEDLLYLNDFVNKICLKTSGSLTKKFVGPERETFSVLTSILQIGED